MKTAQLTLLMGSMLLTTGCLNGGIYDGNKCICLDTFYGSLCENSLDRLPPVKAVNTTVTVTLRITSEVYTEELKEVTTPEYKKFESRFKDEMKTIYYNVPGYKDVEITEITEGSVIVDHKVILEIEYKESSNITGQYLELFEMVNKEIHKAAERDCSDTTTETLCFDENIRVEKHLPPIEDFCKVADGLQKYYMELMTSEGLTCVSSCETISPKYYNCNEGRCVIQKDIGPQCFCPSNEYMYTGSHCTGKILKSIVYGGIAAAIGILLITVATLACFLIKPTRIKKV